MLQRLKSRLIFTMMPCYLLYVCKITQLNFKTLYLTWMHHIPTIFVKTKLAKTEILTLAAIWILTGTLLDAWHLANACHVVTQPNCTKQFWTSGNTSL